MSRGPDRSDVENDNEEGVGERGGRVTLRAKRTGFDDRDLVLARPV